MSNRVQFILAAFQKLCKTKADVDAYVRANGHDYRTDRDTLTTLKPDEKREVWAGIQAIKEKLP